MEAHDGAPAIEEDDIPAHAFGEEPSENAGDSAAVYAAPEPVPASPPRYWHEAISCLTPAKQRAAWQFYHEHEFDTSGRGADTLLGLLILLEANGLYLERCAARVYETAQTVETLRPTPPNTVEANLTDVIAELKNAAASVNASLTNPTPASVPVARKSAVPWLAGLGLGLVLAAVSAFVANRHYATTAALRTQAEVRALKTWLDVNEQAKAILMSRRGRLGFDLRTDASGRKFYSLTVSGTKVEKAYIAPDGNGTIEFTAQ